jgi:hypothetical protein
MNENGKRCSHEQKRCTILDGAQKVDKASELWASLQNSKQTMTWQDAARFHQHIARCLNASLNNFELICLDSCPLQSGIINLFLNQAPAAAAAKARPSTAGSTTLQRVKDQTHAAPASTPSTPLRNNGKRAVTTKNVPVCATLSGNEEKVPDIRRQG